MKTLKLRTLLLIVFICAVIISSLFISTLLLDHQRDITFEMMVSKAENELDSITMAIDNLLTNDIKAPSDSLIGNQDFEELVKSLKQNDNDPQTQKLINTYLLNRYIETSNWHTFDSSKFAVLVDFQGRLYNLKHPYDYNDSLENFIGENRPLNNTIDLAINYLPLRPTFFSSTSENVRENYIIPITRNLIDLTNYSYYATTLFVLSEQDVYNCYKDSELALIDTVYIVDHEGNLVSHSDSDMLTKPEQVQKSEVTGWAIENLNAERTETDIQTFYINRTLNGGQWIAVAEYSLADINEQIASTIIRYVTMIIIVLMAVCLFIAVFATELTKPIYKLVESMAQAGERNFTKTIEEKGTSDMQILIKGYNKLLDDLDTVIYREYEVEKKRQRAELDVLVTQINPHFLYNTLESIVWQARKAGITTVADMAHSLGVLFNIGVNKGASTLTLKQELEHVEMYMALQNIRYENMFELNTSCDDEELLSCSVLKILLQPLAENAILHGFKGKTTNCIIHIHAEAVDGALVIYVEDNGIGMPAEQLQALQERLDANRPLDEYDTETANEKGKRGSGIGIINVHQRIRLYYGKKYGLSVQGGSDGGTCFSVTLPLQQSPKNQN